MKVIVDTCVWSLALRRKQVGINHAVLQLKKLLQEGRVQLLGPIRQEILSGVASTQDFMRLKQELSKLEDLPILTEDHERGALYFNRCRARGIQGSHTDFLLCAISFRLNYPLLTTDVDFRHYAKCCDFELLE